MSIEEMEEVIEEIETSQNDEEDVGIYREERENEIETVDEMYARLKAMETVIQQ